MSLDNFAILAFAVPSLAHTAQLPSCQECHIPASSPLKLLFLLLDRFLPSQHVPTQVSFLRSPLQNKAFSPAVLWKVGLLPAWWRCWPCVKLFLLFLRLWIACPFQQGPVDHAEGANDVSVGQWMWKALGNHSIRLYCVCFFFFLNLVQAKSFAKLFR